MKMFKIPKSLFRRNLHATAVRRQSNAINVGIVDGAVELKGSSLPSPLKINNFWLRDHCLCSECFNHGTHQRNFDLLSIPPEIQPTRVELSSNGEEVKVQWPDRHLSAYSTKWLLQAWIEGQPKVDNGLLYEERHVKTLWDGGKLEALGGIPTVNFDSLLAPGTDEGRKAVTTNLLTYGVTKIINTPVDAAKSKLACQQVGLLQENVYGDYWVINPATEDEKEKKDTHHEDTAYSNEALGAHTDGAYSKQTPGVQTFHIMSVPPSGGGKSLVVDGFHAISRLKETDPQGYQFLSHTHVPHHFIEPGSHLRSMEPVITLHPLTHAVVQLRFNPYDRSPITHLREEELNEFYRSYTALARIIRDPESEYWTQLTPGTIMLTDNWRVMHGRSAFLGKRILSGCYISRDDFLSRARAFHLL